MSDFTQDEINDLSMDVGPEAPLAPAAAPASVPTTPAPTEPAPTGSFTQEEIDELGTGADPSEVLSSMVARQTEVADPDAYAAARKMAKQSGITDYLITGDLSPKRVRAQTHLEETRKMLAEYPNLLEFLKNKDNQTLTLDDMGAIRGLADRMSRMRELDQSQTTMEFAGDLADMVVNAFSAAGTGQVAAAADNGGVINAGDRIGFGSLATLAMSKENSKKLLDTTVASLTLPRDQQSRFTKLAVKYNKEMKEAQARATANGGYWKEVLVSTLSSTAQMAPAVVATLLTRNPTLGSSLMGTQVFGLSYAEAREKGRTVDEAILDATFKSSIEMISERIPLGTFLEGGNRLTSALKGMGLEGLQEVFVSLVNSAYDAGIVGDDMTFADVMRDASQSFFAGAGAYATLRAPVEATRAAMGKLLPDRQSAAYEKALLELKDDVDAAKTTARAPEVMREALQAMEGDSEIYVDVDEILDLEQGSELITEALSTITGSSDVSDAMTLGSDVAVKASDLLMLPKEMFDVIAPSVRRNIGADTARQAQAKLDEREGTVQRLLDNMRQEVEADAAARPIYNTVQEQLSATGRYTESQAARAAELVAERYEARAANTTKTAEELFLEDNVRIRTGRASVQPSATTLEQPVSELKDVDLEELLAATEAQVKKRPAGSLDVYPAAMPPEYAFSNYEAVGGRMVEFTPDQLLALSSDMPIDAEVRENADDLAQMMLDGQRIDPPYLVVRDDGVVDSHDGRHRALAAKQLGIGKIPVLLMGEGGTAFPSTTRSIRPQLGARDPSFVGTLEQSAAPLQEQPLTIVGTGPGGRVLNRDIGKAFTDRHMATYGRALDPEDPADYDIMLNSLLADYAEQSRQPDSGDSWYTDDIAEAVRLTEYIYPELANPQFRDLFLTVTALLSPQQKPGPNWENAILALRSWKETGRIDLTKPSGAKFGVNTKGLQLLQHMIDTKGLEGAMRWVQEEHTGTEMAEIRRDSGLFVEKPRLGQYTPSELNLKSVTLGIYMFGPKVGDFMQNSAGIDQNAVTVDLWAARSYNRYVGRLLDTPDGDLVGDVRGAKERNQIKRLIRDAAEQAGIDPSAMQAALWYFEQRLYRSHGVKAVSQNFSGAAETALKSRGLEDALRTPVSYQQDAVGDAGKSPSASPARPVATEGERPGRDIRAGAVGRGELGAGQEGVPAAPLQPLPGAPKLSGEQFGPIPELVSAAEAYADKAGIRYTRQPVYVPITPSRSERIAQAYEAAEHEPKNPDVRRAYRALITQTKAQYDALIEAGYTFTFFDDTADPYDGNPWNAMRDLRDNKTMAVYSTLAGYGTDQTFDSSENMLLEDTGLTWQDQNGNDVKVLANDLFRAVHDAFGHGLEGAGFRARGEENAWQAHARLFTGEAVKALTTETRGQNSWLNYGPYGEQNRTAGLEDTVFGDQKMTLLPSWVSSEGTTGLYGLPVNEDGTVTLTHFSETEGLTQLDPSYHGTGMAGDEGARKSIEGWVDRTYFGVSVGKEGGYVSEFPEGTAAYETRVPADRLYDYQQDPDGLMETVKDQAITQRRANGDHLYDQAKAYTLYEKAIADAGYEGYFNNAMQGLTVAKFTPTEVVPSGSASLAQQQEGVTARGSFQQERDTYGNLENIITLMENADLSTFLHEGGHFWLFQMKQDLDSDYLTDEGRARLQKQFEVTTEWFRQNSKQAWSDIQKLAKAARKAADRNPDDARAQVRAERMEAAVSRAKRGGGVVYMEEVADNFMNGSVENGTDLEVAYHELWARGVEKYLGEGKAPSAALRNAFSSFSAWMTSIYRNLSALNVTLNDDVRGVFDRLLATEEAIYREKQREVYKIPRELRELLNDRELKELETLSREAELEAQQEMQLLIAEELRELQSAERKAARERFTKEATEQVHSEPVYRAQRAARKGEGPNGIEYKNAKGQKTPIKILREEAVALLGADVVRKLPRWLFTKDADAAVGMHELALLSGFGSPAEMADTIIDTPISIDSAIDAVVEDRMKQEFGDFTDEANLAEIAADVVLNDKQVELAKAQSRILKSKASGLVSTAAERQVLEEGAVSAQEAIGRVLEAETQSGFAPTAEDAVPEQLRAITAEEQRTAAIPQRKAQTAARKRITEIMRDIDPAAVKEAAARFVQSSTVKVLTPQRYIAAAERAARKADKAIAERDYEGAAALLEQRTLNLEIAKQVRDAQKKLNGTVDRIKKTLRRSDAQTATYRNVDLINLVRDVMGSAGVSKLVLVDTAAARASVLAELGADSPSYALVSDTLTSMEDALSPHLERPAPYKELTYAEATSLLNDALSLMTLARDMRTAVVQGRRVLHAEIADEVRDTATRVGKSTRKYGGTRNDRSRIASWSALKHATRRMENWARAADGGSPAGPITRSIVQPVFTAIGEYYKNRVQPLKSLVDLVVPMRAELGVEVNISAPELSSAGGAAYVFRTKGELIHAILHTGNDSNKQKLLRAGRVDIATGEKYIWGSLAEDGTLDTSRWDAFMTRMFEEGVITKADMDLVQGIWNIFAETKKAAQAAHKQMFGFEFEEISSSPVETPFGSYPGGYVPAVTDRMMDIAGGAKVDADNLASQQNASMFPGAERGFTKSRVEAYAEPLQLDLTSIASHFDRVMKFAYLGPAVREAAYLATSREFRSAVNQYDNGAVDDIIIPFLQRAARQTDSEPSKMDPLIKPLAVLSRRVGLHIMAGNLVNAAQQATGLSVAAAVVKPHYLAKHLNTFRVDGVRIREYIAGKDPYMAERFKSGVIDFSIELDKILTDKSTLRMLEEQSTRYGYTFQQVFQNLLDPVIWMAAEEQFKAGPDWQTVYKNNEYLGHDTAVERADAAAVYYASSVIRMTQTAMDPASLSAIEASNAIGKAILKFYSYFNSMLNFSETEFKLAAEEIGWSHRAGKAFYLYLTIIMVPAVAAKAISMAAGGDLDEFEEEDDFVAKMAELFIVSQAEYVAGFIPGGSGVFRAVKGQFTDVQYDDRLTFSPTVSVVEGALQGTVRLVKDVVQYFDEGEVARDGSRVVKDILTAFALATGLPTNWFSKPLQYLQKVEEGRAEPEGVVDFVQGLLTGRDGTPQ